jgi:hypothetical protein
MKPKDRRKEGKGGLALVEEAVQLLRLNAGAVLAAYYAGTLPFILGLLFFWADMSRSPYAAQHLAGASLGMALLFLWMKFWQAIFVDGLRARISAGPPTRWNLRRAFRVLIIQSAIQPSAAIALPLSVVAMGLPFPWVYAFYQNVTALTDGETAEIRKPLRRAWRQAWLWPGQNHIILGVLLAFGLFVLLNIVTVFVALPHLLKMFLGIESAYTQSTSAMFNTTFVAAVFGLTYLCVDPIAKAVYLLRCFYGESLETGEDLRAELRLFGAPARATALGALLVIALATGGLRAAEGPPAGTPPQPAQPASISPPALDKAIDEVIHKSKYTWRMPREKVVEKDAGENAVTRFFQKAGNWIRDALNWIAERLDKWFGRRSPGESSRKSGWGWVSALQLFCVALLAVVVSALAIMLIRMWQRRQRQPAPLAAESIARAPDLADENVGADQLPEDGWIKMGRELLASGEFRLALRAFYFASLAHLATRNLLSIAKFKSNRDYESELGRRGHSLPDLRSKFGENVMVFDRSWYGLHDVDKEMVEHFLSNVERIKGV